LINDTTEVTAFLPQRGPRAVVLDLFDPTLPLSPTTLRHLRREHPSLALVVTGDFSGREMDLYRLGRMNVDGVIRLETRPEPREIVSVVDDALAACLAEVVVNSVALDLPPLAREAVRWVVEKAESRPRVSDMAAALALTPRNLSRGLRTRDLAPARTLLLWGRLLQASHLLERDGETVENVAFRLGYATAGTLGRALKAHVGSSPTALIRGGGLQLALRAFRKRGLTRGAESRSRWTRARRSRWRTPFRSGPLP
jgi:AraC-like DNA-binding protein